MPDNPQTAEGFAAVTGVSRETLAGYIMWGDLLTRWNKKINLVAPGSDLQFWPRHAFDSWQITQHLPKGWDHCVDFGSGAGFPGLAVAIQAKERGSGKVSLIESVGKKASFLRTVIRELNLPATVYSERIETVAPLSADIITARAFAPLNRLLPLADRHLGEGGLCLLLKGERYASEIEEAKLNYDFDVVSDPSQTHQAGRILKISKLETKKIEAIT